MLTAWTDSLWTHEMPHRVAGFQMGARMTVLRSSQGDLTLISPIAIEPAVEKELRRLGPVRHVVAPNLMHYRYLPATRAMFPEATIIAAPGLREKRPDLPIDAVVGPEWDARLEVEHLITNGMAMFGDVVFFQPRSRTIIVTDVFANFRSCNDWWTRIYLKMGGAYGKPAQTLLLKAMVKDRRALLASRDAMLRWDFDRLIVAHGDVVERGGKEALLTALPGDAAST